MDANSKSDREKSVEQSNDALLDEAEVLIWDLLDEKIDSAHIRRLESLLRENEQVRQRYLCCAQLHADLHQHYGGEIPVSPAPGRLPQSPVLGQLGDLQPETIHLPPVVE